MKAAEAIESRESEDAHCDFSGYAQDETERLISGLGTESRFPVMYIRDMLAETMKNDLGIIRDENRLRGGIEEDAYRAAPVISYDNGGFNVRYDTEGRYES